MSELITTGLWSDGGTITERRSQDVEPILELNKALRNSGQVGGNEFRHAAKIPFAAIETYIALNGISLHEFHANPVHLKTMLNDPNLSECRIWQGRV